MRAHSEKREKCTMLLFSCSTVSNSLWPHGLQQARLPCSSPSPGACSNSCPLSRWCHHTTSSSVVPFSSCPQPFPESGAFLMVQLLVSCGQSIGTSASVLPVNIQGWFPLGLTGFDLLAVQGTVQGKYTIILLNYSISSSSEYSGLISFRIDWFWSPCCPRDCPREVYYNTS